MIGDTVRVIVTGDVEVVKRLHAVPGALRANVGRALKRLGIALENRVKTEKLSGQVLKVRSGRLRSSITSTYAEDGDILTSTTGTNVIYGRFWELGFHGTETVRAHVRRVKSRNVRGRINDIVGHDGSRAGKTLIALGIALVSEHTRRVDQAPRPFLRPSIEEMRDQARTELQRATRAAIEGR